MPGRRVILLCHRCNEPYAEVCAEPHEHRNSLCVYGDWYADVRLCACGKQIHKDCFKDQVACPDLQEVTA